MRAEILTVLAFADDCDVMIKSAEALPDIEVLSDDWGAASNGEFNRGKFEALGVGSKWGEHPLALTIRTLQDEEGMTWVGFPFARDGNIAATYELALERVRRAITRASHHSLSPSSRAHYANTYIISTILHLLSFLPPPPSFTHQVDSALLDFVWGSKYHAVQQGAVYLARSKGGLGLISVRDVGTAAAIRMWDGLAGGSEPIWRPLAAASFERAVGPGGVAKVWSFLLSPLQSVKDDRWLSLLQLVKQFPPALDFERLLLPHLLLLPPGLPQLLDATTVSKPDATALRRHATVASIYTRKVDPGEAERPWTPVDIEDQPYSLNAWNRLAHRIPGIRYQVPSTATLERRLPSPILPPSSAFSFFNLPRPHSVSALRRAVAAARNQDEDRGRDWPAGTTEKEKGDFWKWFRKGGASARERDQHWRLLYGATPVRSRLVHQGHADTAFCLHCPTDVKEDVLHYYFKCEWSTYFWTSLNTTFTDLFRVPNPALQLIPLDIVMGLPKYRATLPPSDQRALRLFVAIAVQAIHDARWAAQDGLKIIDAQKLALTVEKRVQLRMGHT